MLRALLARLGLVETPPRQLELALGGEREAMVDAPKNARGGAGTDVPADTQKRQGTSTRRGARGNGTGRTKTVMPDREVDGRFNPGGAPRSDDAPRPRTRPPAPAPASSLVLDFPDAPDIAPSSAPSSAAELQKDPATAERLRQRLETLGMHGISALRLTSNRSTLVSFRAGRLRLHAAFQHAPDDVLRAVAAFVSGCGAARAAARRIIVAYPLPRDATPRRPRAERLHPDDQALAERLREAHARLNQERFGGTLQSIRVTVSRRMTTRLGHYAPARSHPGGAEISISRRHIRRHGWREAFDTLLHEMVHQWQEENAHPIDHGPLFRRKARDVGTTPRARRVLR